MLRPAGIARKLPDRIALTIQDEAYFIRLSDIPRLKQGLEIDLYLLTRPRPVKGGFVHIWFRQQHRKTDMVKIDVQGTQFSFPAPNLYGLLNGRYKTSQISEYVPDIWRGFGQEVTA